MIYKKNDMQQAVDGLQSQKYLLPGLSLKSLSDRMLPSDSIIIIILATIMVAYLQAGHQQSLPLFDLQTNLPPKVMAGDVCRPLESGLPWEFFDE